MLSVYLYSTGPSLADGAAGSRIPIGDTQLAQSTKSDNIKNIQRLLTLLADRYKTKYGTVNPGRVDGSFGAETKTAIRNYQEITGVDPDSQTHEQLVADILASLAEMSATQPQDESTGTTKQTAAVTPVAPKAASPAPAQGAVKVASLNNTTAAAAAPTQAAPVPPAKSPVPPELVTKVQAVAQSPAAPTNDRVYFSQLASLRTLDAAQNEWQRIFDANRAALNGEQVYFEEAEIAGRGTFHRILVGPIPERAAAKTLCNFLKQNEQPCVVISRFLSSLRNLKDKNGMVAPPVLPASGESPKQQQAAATPARETVDGTPAAVAPQAAAVAETTDTKSGTAVESATPAQSTDSGGDSAGTKAEAAENPMPVLAETPQKATVPSAEEASKVFTESAISTASKTESPNSSAVAQAVASENLTMPAAADNTVTVPETPVPANPDDTSETKTVLVAPLPPKPEDTETGPPTTGTDPKGVPAASPESTVAVIPAAGTTRQGAPTIRGIASDIRDYVGGTQNLIGFIAVVIVGAAILQFIWWRRNRSLAFTQIFRSGGLTFGQPVPVDLGPEDALAALETGFESEQLKQSRSVRDEFLRDILGDEVDLDSATDKKEPAIRINSSLKSLLISDPAQYKSIFLNWIFLSKVGAALNQQEITMEDLNGHFGREFNLLQNYFKIHLLELDDRHRIRKELPGLFYCLQLAQQRQRQAAGAA